MCGIWAKQSEVGSKVSEVNKILPNPLTHLPDSLVPRREGGIFKLTPTPLLDTRSSLGEGQMLDTESPPSLRQTAASFAWA